MIRVTRLDGASLYINEQNIQWIEMLPDTAITFVAGARLLVREKMEEILQAISQAERLRCSIGSAGEGTGEASSDVAEEAARS